jgi:hypothetical protein
MRQATMPPLEQGHVLGISRYCRSNQWRGGSDFQTIQDDGAEAVAIGLVVVVVIFTGPRKGPATIPPMRYRLRTLLAFHG